MTASAPRRYLFDARVIQDHFPGIGRYAWNLLHALPALLQPDERLIVLHDPAAKNARLPSPLSAPAGAAASRVSFIEHRAPIFGASNAVRALPAQGNVEHHLYYVRPYARGRQAVTTIYDAISFVYPQHVPSARARLLIGLFHRLAIGASRRIITISQSAADDLARQFPASRGKLEVTPLAADAVFAPQPQAQMRSVRDRFGLHGRFALYLASNKPHKNLPRLMDAFAATPAEDVTLVIAGHQDARYPQAQQRVSALGLGSRVRVLGPVSDADAAALYSTCDVFVYPSLYEGFGLTPLEAMACGAPTICSNTSALPEVGGDAALLVDPSDTGAIAAAMARVLGDAALRTELSRKSLAQAARFSWAKTAEHTIEIYRALSRV